MSGYVKGGSSNTESQAGRMEQFLPLPLHFQGKLRKSGGERKKNKGRLVANSCLDSRGTKK